MKKFIVGVFVVMFLFISGCNSAVTSDTADESESKSNSNLNEEERTINANAEIVCVAEKYTSQLGEIMNIDNLLEMSEEEIIATREKSQNLNKQMEEEINQTILNYGFSDKEEFNNATARYFTNDEIDRKAKDLVIEKCGLDLDKLMEESTDGSTDQPNEESTEE